MNQSPLTTMAGGYGRSAELIDKNMSGVIGAQKNYAQATEAANSPLPFETISGPTTDMINNGQSRMGTFEYLARGGIENSAKRLANKIAIQQREKQQKQQYEQLLEMGEKGAAMLYQDALNTYGEPIRNWIPPTTFFYDEKTGAFMPHEYAKKVAYGIQMYETALEKSAQQEKEVLAQKQAEEARVRGLQTVGGIVRDATTQQGAAAQIAQAGLNPDEYDKSLSRIPSEKDKAQTGYYNRMPSTSGSGGGGGKDKTDPQAIINTLESRKIEYEKMKQAKQAELRDPARNFDVNVDNGIMADIKKFERAIAGIDRQIEEQKALAKGQSPNSLPSEKSAALANRIRESVAEKLPQGHGQRKLLGVKLGEAQNPYTLGNDGIVTDDQGNPQYAMYDDLIVSGVLDMMDQRGITLPGLPGDGAGRADVIARSIKEAGLESTLEILEELTNE